MGPLWSLEDAPPMPSTRICCSCHRSPYHHRPPQSVHCPLVDSMLLYNMRGRLDGRIVFTKQPEPVEVCQHAVHSACSDRDILRKIDNPRCTHLFTLLSKLMYSDQDKEQFI